MGLNAFGILIFGVLAYGNLEKKAMFQCIFFRNLYLYLKRINLGFVFLSYRGLFNPSGLLGCQYKYSCIFCLSLCFK